MSKNKGIILRNLYLGASVIAISALMSSTAFAAEAEAEATASVSEIIVTGTRVTGLKAEDSAAPVQVLGAQALRRVGQPDLIQAMAQNLPSFTAEATGGDTGNLTLSAALRGLNPNDTLVLVNGKRRHPTGNLHVLGGPYQGAATADLSLIPVGAIDHIEVLQDGAAAQYGTDAIAGVVNIILKSANSGGSAVASAGQYYKGDGETGALSLNFGAPIGEAGFVNVTLENRYHGFSVRGGPDRRVLSPSGGILPGDNAIDKAGLAGAKNFPVVNLINGDAQYNIYNGYLNAGYKFSDELEAYATASYSHRLASAYENYRVPSKVTRPGPGGTTIVPFPNGFDPKEHLEEDDYSLGGGLKGVADGWDWDLSSVYGHVRDQVSTLNTANASLFFDTGLTPRNFYDGAFRSTEWTNNLDIAKDFDTGMASPLTVAFGGEYRRNTFEISPGDPFSTYKEGGQSYPGFQATDAGTHHRTNYGAYADLAAEVVAGLKVDLAGRYEHYSDFGSTTVFKATGRYDFNPMVAVRGTISTGFRAPTLAEEFYSATNVGPTSAFVQLPPNAAAAALVGINGLKPEKSRNFSLGVVMRPTDRLVATLDAYQIKIDDRIVGSGQLFGSSDGNLISPAVIAAIAANGNVLDPAVVAGGVGTSTGITMFSNGLNTRTRGVDLVMSLPSDYSFGRVDWSLSGNYNKTEVTDIAPTPAPLAPQSFYDLTALSNLETASPKYRSVLGAFWSYSNFSANLRETVYGPSSRMDQRTSTTPFHETRIGVTPITDLELAYQTDSKSMKLSIGANNLFNRYPNGMNKDLLAEQRAVNSNSAVTIYPSFSPFGINGGYYYARALFTF